MFRVQNRTLKRLLGAYLHLKNFLFYISLFIYYSIFYNKIIYYILYYYILYVCVRMREVIGIWKGSQRPYIGAALGALAARCLGIIVCHLIWCWC